MMKLSIYTSFFLLLLLSNGNHLLASENESWWMNSSVEKWQIADYVQHLHGEKVAASQEEMDYDNGQYWYFETLNNKGGYAMITGAVDGYKEYVLWRRKDGKDLVGELAVGCGPACSYDFRFHLGNGASISKIETADIIPVKALNDRMAILAKKSNEVNPVDYAEDQQLFFDFPQVGTAMEVHIVLGADEMMIKLGKLNWNKMTFTIDYLLDQVEQVD